jgi:hypothetical protein
MRAVHPGAVGYGDAAQAVHAAYEARRSGVRRGEQLTALMTDRDTRLGTAYEPGTGKRTGRGAARGAAPTGDGIAGSSGLPPCITDAAVLNRVADLLMVPWAARTGNCAHIVAR